jgi:hypothetical protein
MVSLTIYSVCQNVQYLKRTHYFPFVVFIVRLLYYMTCPQMLSIRAEESLLAGEVNHHISHICPTPLAPSWLGCIPGHFILWAWSTLSTS